MFPKWWCKMVIYYGRIRKKNPQTKQKQKFFKGYPSSHKHGSVKYVLPIAVTFQIRPVSTEAWLWEKEYQVQLVTTRIPSSPSPCHWELALYTVAPSISHQLTVVSGSRWATKKNKSISYDTFHSLDMFNRDPGILTMAYYNSYITG